MSPAAIALSRFGLGARADEATPADPSRWLLAQLDHFDPRPPAIAAAAGGRDVVGLVIAYNLCRSTRRKATREAMQASGVDGAGDQPWAGGSRPQSPAVQAADAETHAARDAIQDAFEAQAAARVTVAIDGPTPFVERLVHFWANHFTISNDLINNRALAGAVEFEAIRPHVLGRFEDMLLAVEHHPGMLMYLDQVQSAGPGSPFALRMAERAPDRKLGLNENLAREILELHTLGVRTGYTQADVTEFARALTGWRVGGLNGAPGRGVPRDAEPGRFVFADDVHEPGARTLLGRRYDQPGEAQGRAILIDLARDPRTATHLATRLARHFAADDPPPALVARLAQAYHESGGALPAMYRVLIDAPEIWSAPPRLKSPSDWLLSAWRALGTRDMAHVRPAELLSRLGQPLWKPGAPAGYDDGSAGWAGSDALFRRVEVADRLAGQTAHEVDPRALAEKVLPGSVAPATMQAIARADSPAQGLALLLASPEFLRR